MKYFLSVEAVSNDDVKIYVEKGFDGNYDLVIERGVSKDTIELAPWDARNLASALTYFVGEANQ